MIVRATAVLLLTLASPSLLACMCPGVPVAKKSFQTADVVFAGTVASIDGPADVEKGGLERVVFERTRVWKGAAARRIEVWTGGGCDYRFRTGHSYIVFGVRSEDGRLREQGCSFSSPLVCARRESSLLAHLGLRDTGAPPDVEPYPLPEASCIQPPLLIPKRGLGSLLRHRNPHVKIVIGRDGRVQHFSFADNPFACFECSPAQREKLERTVRQWRFRPAMLDGAAVAVELMHLSETFPKRETER